MSIIPRWGNNTKTIIHMEFIDEFSWSEMPTVRKAIVEMLESVPHMVDFIADFREVDRISPGALAVGRSIFNQRLPNEGVSIIVGVSPILRMLFQSFLAAYPASQQVLILVSTLDEAYQKLTEIQQNRDDK